MEGIPLQFSETFQIQVSDGDLFGPATNSPRSTSSFENFKSFSELIRYVLSMHKAVVSLPPKLRSDLYAQWNARAAKHDGKRVAKSRKSIESVSDLKNTLILTTRGAAGVTAVRLGGTDTTYKIFLESHQILLTAGRIFGITDMDSTPCQVDSRLTPTQEAIPRSTSVDERFVEARATTANSSTNRRPHPWESTDRQNVLNLQRTTTATIGGITKNASRLHRTNRTSGVFRKLFGRSHESSESIAPMPSANIKPG